MALPPEKLSGKYLADFKSANKFVIAYGDVITQGGCRVANVANKIYCNPKGGVDWRGYSCSCCS